MCQSAVSWWEKRNQKINNNQGKRHSLFYVRKQFENGSWSKFLFYIWNLPQNCVDISRGHNWHTELTSLNHWLFVYLHPGQLRTWRTTFYCKLPFLRYVFLWFWLLFSGATDSRWNHCRRGRGRPSVRCLRLSGITCWDVWRPWLGCRYALRIHTSMSWWCRNVRMLYSFKLQPLHFTIGLYLIWGTVGKDVSWPAPIQVFFDIIIAALSLCQKTLSSLPPIRPLSNQCCLCRWHFSMSSSRLDCIA